MRIVRTDCVGTTGIVLVASVADAGAGPPGPDLFPVMFPFFVFPTD